VERVESVVGNKTSNFSILAIALGSVLAAFPAQAQTRPIDVEHSRLTVRVFKAGLFSAFGHEHEIAAPIASGTVDESDHSMVEFRVEAAKLKVVDPGESEGDRAKVQKTMETEVLAVAQFPEIRFVSTGAEKAGEGRWTVHGNLTLHGETRPLAVKAEMRDGKYRGEVMIRQRDFGITPVNAGGGTVKVKDELKIEFEIAVQR
jgi:polyisoprenoid-binding protein YceI